MAIPPLRRFRCFEYRRRLGGGLSQPLLMAAEDEAGNAAEVVVKVRHPDFGSHFGPTSLACELTCALVADILELPIPAFGIAQLDESILPGLPTEKLRQLHAANLGENFATVFMEGYRDWGAEERAETEVLRVELERTLSFDGSVTNNDRSVRKSNLLVHGNEVCLVDHSLAFHWTLSGRMGASFSDQAIRNHCSFRSLAGRSRLFQDLFDRWSTRVTTEVLDQIRQLVPSGWERHPGELDSIFGFLHARASQLQELRNTLLRVVK